MDQTKIERMLRLMTLMTGDTNYTVQELSTKLGMSYRSVYRYIDTFKAAGLAVEKLDGNIYRLVTMKRPYPDLSKMVYFSEEEAAIVANMIDRLDETNVLKQGLKRKLAAVYDSTSIADFIDKKSNAVNVQSLADAIKGKKKVILHGCESANSGAIRDRHVEPFSFTTNYIDIWAYDLEDGINKRFKIARIDEVEIQDEPWTAEKSHKAQPIDCFRIHGHRPTKVKLQLSQRAKNLLLEEYPLSEKYVRKVRNKWVFDGPVCGMEGVGRFVLGLKNEIEIIESDELKQYVADYNNKEYIIDTLSNVKHQ